MNGMTPAGIARQPDGRWRVAGLVALLSALALAAAPLTGCSGDDGPKDAATVDAAGADGVGTPHPLDLDPPLEDVPDPLLRRLTASQYRNTIRDWFGDELVLPGSLEPDVRSEGLYSVGASVSGLSTLGVERYRNAAKSIAGQLVEIVPLRDALLACDGSADADGCLAEFIATWGERLWRRPLTADEATRLTKLGNEAIDTLGAFDEGLRYVLMALLASPKFVYVHTPGADSVSRTYDGYEMATRLALFLWNSAPDAWLLGQAAEGKLDEGATIGPVVQTMLDDERAIRGLRAFATDWLELDLLDTLSKDPEIYTYFSPDIGKIAREETLMLIEHIALDAQADFRTLLTTTTTFVDKRLAALYGIPAPADDGFAKVELPEGGPRAGLLGHVSVLAINASPNRSSPTERGIFVRERLLCQKIPPPPAGVDTTIPEGGADAPTMRERLTVHLESPQCAGCHRLTDRIGLGLERFDGLGGFRTTENGVAIDPADELDGTKFADARGLGQAIAQHDDFPRCVVRKLWAHATGDTLHPVTERPQRDALVNRFADSGYQLRALIEDIVTSAQFRRVGPPSEELPSDGAEASGEEATP